MNSRLPNEPQEPASAATALAAERLIRWTCRMDAPRTPLKTELKWMLGVVLVSGGIAVGLASYILWRVFAAAAHC